MANCINGQMPVWSATDDELHCGVMPTTKVAEIGLLQLHYADNNAVTWLCGNESTFGINLFVSVFCIWLKSSMVVQWCGIGFSV